jgi:hypothetical protein
VYLFKAMAEAGEGIELTNFGSEANRTDDNVDDYDDYDDYDDNFADENTPLLRNTDEQQATTSFINTGETTADDEGDNTEIWEVSNETPSWAQDGVPAGLDEEDRADPETTAALIARWRAELKSTAEIRNEMVASKRGDLWVRQGKSWILLTYKNKPGVFLAPSTLARYGADVTKLLGVHEQSKGRLSQEASAKILAADMSLAGVERDLDTTNVKGLATTVDKVVQTVEKFTDDAGNFLPMREIMALNDSLQTTRGEFENNAAKLDVIDREIEREEKKLAEAKNTNLGAPKLGDASSREAAVSRIEERLQDLRIERDWRLEALSVNRKALRSQVSRIRETISRMLHKDTTLAERVRTLFREQGITIASMLAAVGLAVSSLVAWLTGGAAAATPAPTPTPPDGKGGVKEWVKRQLEAIKRLLGKLAGKAAAALPGIIGSIVSWLLSTLGKAVGWLAENTWALIVGAVGLLIIVLTNYINRPRQK